MLFQPTNIIPSSFAGVGGDLIDVTDGMTISWQVNGNSPMTGYRIIIYQNNDPSTQMYTTGVVTLGSPFYGTDGMGNIQRFSVTLSAATLSGAGIVNGYSRGYKFTIRQYWGANEYADQTTENYFITRAKPSASISTASIDSPTATLTGTYTQAQGDGLDWVRWVIAGDGKTVEDSGKIHTQELSYTYDGFLDDTTYAITMEYQTQSGYQGSVSKNITTDWTLLDLREASLSVTPAEGCIGAVIETPKIASGALLAATGTYSVTDGVLRISDTGYLEWVGDSQNPGDTFVWQGVLNDGDELNVEVGTQFGGGKSTFRIYADTTSFHFRWIVNNTDVADTDGDKTLIYNQRITLIINKDQFRLVNSSDYSFAGPSYQYAFLSKTSGMYFKLTGKASCNYLGVGKFGAILKSPNTDYELISKLSGTSQPDLDDRWIYLSNWANNGVTNIGTTTETVIDATASLYREDLSTGVMRKLCSTPSGSTIIDYGVTSRAAYQYLQVVSVTTGVDEEAQAIYRMNATAGFASGELLDATDGHSVSNGSLSIAGSDQYLEWGGECDAAGDTLVWKGTVPSDGYMRIEVTTGGVVQRLTLSKYPDSYPEWGVYWTDGTLSRYYASEDFPGYLCFIINKKRLLIFDGNGSAFSPIGPAVSNLEFSTSPGPVSLRLSGKHECRFVGIGQFGDLIDDTTTYDMIRRAVQPEYDDRWIYLSNWAEHGVSSIGAVEPGEEYEQFSACFWNWVVDTGRWDDERKAYEYTGSYIFALNVETDSFDNNNNPNLLQNFTRYPTRQGTNQNYLSGQLTGYIGHVDKENNVYIDTAEEAEAIRALSTSTDTKFLRSRKGERWMIDTSGPIRLTVGDKYEEQPYTMSLPWVEVGDADHAPLISLPGDAAWPLD